MTIPVPLSDLEAALQDRGAAAYLVTVADDVTPHVVLADVTRSGRALMADVGARTASHALIRPHVTVLYPIRHSADYSLIVDGMATVTVSPAGARLALEPTRAVLYRAAHGSPPVGSSCGSDCVSVSLDERT